MKICANNKNVDKKTADYLAGSDILLAHIARRRSLPFKNNAHSRKKIYKIFFNYQLYPELQIQEFSKKFFSDMLQFCIYHFKLLKSIMKSSIFGGFALLYQFYIIFFNN
jgi:hypothetical protein